MIKLSLVYNETTDQGYESITMPALAESSVCDVNACPIDESVLSKMSSDSTFFLDLADSESDVITLLAPFEDMPQIAKFFEELDLKDKAVVVMNDNLWFSNVSAGVEEIAIMVGNHSDKLRGAYIYAAHGLIKSGNEAYNLDPVMPSYAPRDAVFASRMDIYGTNTNIRDGVRTISEQGHAPRPLA